MPGMDGWTVAETLRTTGHHQARILMISASALEAHGLPLAQPYHDGYLMKPIDVSRVLEQIGQLLKIDWQYVSREKPDPVWTPGSGPLPSAQDMQELIDLGQIGHVKAIQAKLDQLDADHPEHAAFVTRDPLPRRRFRFQSIRRHIENAAFARCRFRTISPMTHDPKRRDVALVIDDSPETLRLLTDALDAAGMTVMVALDGAAAMRIVEQITPDIILLDAVMPGMDGFETCRRLKRDAGLGHVPVIFMTGLAETEHIVRGLDAGGVDYVTKPIAIPEMLARIRVHLVNARLAQSARMALDVSGRFLFAANRQGTIVWATPQAQNCWDMPQSTSLRFPLRCWSGYRKSRTGAPTPSRHRPHS